MNRRCNECGEPYTVGHRGQGGLFHFMIVTLSEPADDHMKIIGHWRSGDWVTGQTLYLRRRDGHHMRITGAEMLPPLNEVCEKRGQRTLLIPKDKSFQPRGCIWATSESETG